MLTLRRITLLVFGLVFLSATAWAGTPGFQGNVKGPDGKALKGVEVRIQPKGSKTFSGSAKTDQGGRFAFKDLAMGEYTVTVAANGMATATIEHLKTRSDGAVAVDFKMQKQVGSAQAAPAAVKKRRVWVQETGSHLGHWEDVDENGNTAEGARKVQQINRNQIDNMQSMGAAMPGSH
jgi:hypothetical protein